MHLHAVSLALRLVDDELLDELELDDRDEPESEDEPCADD